MISCVLLHGFAGTPAAWEDVIGSWQLPARPRTVALPGHGGGEVQPTWETNLASVASALDDCEVVVGYSLGARVALGLVTGGYVECGVLIGVNPGIGDDERAARRASDARWSALLRERGVAEFDDAWTAQPLFATQQRAPSDRRAARRAHRLTLDAEQLARSLEVMGLAEMPDYRGRLAKHRDRIALIAGADDTKYVALADAMPCRSFEKIAGSGHDPTLEQPAALAAAIARAFASLR